ncbi:hypothetical protein [Chitinophaga sp.]|uniref:hypothetical protein n=1 Tax=Chitinophaga sp. TaxID=1869181 RepID=UPI0031DC597C
MLLLILVMMGLLLSCRAGYYAGGHMSRKRSGIIPCPTVGEHKERRIFSRSFYQ